MYSIQKLASGRFDVLAENGMHAGLILSSNGEWFAEAGGNTVAHFSSQNAAALGILEHRGIKGIFDQMREVIEAPDSLLRENKGKFYIKDQAFISSWKCATDMLWIVHPSGTHIIPLDISITKKEALNLLYEMHPNQTKLPWELRIVNTYNFKVQIVTEQHVRSRLSEPPKYQSLCRKEDRRASKTCRNCADHAALWIQNGGPQV